MQHVVLTGSESVGKTTLAAELGAHYHALVVPEFVRGYAEQKGAALGFTDVEPIARGQMQLTDEHTAQAMARGDRLLIHDTDLVSTLVYSRHYYGQCPPVVETEAVRRRAALYLLLDIDVPWIADGVRDRGEQRAEVHRLFVDTLERLRAPYVTVRGNWSARRVSAIRAIDALLTSA